jgi:SAM-dependent methyltransferase
MLKSEHNQRELFNSIAKAYHDHYNDKYSILYRYNFIIGPLFKNIELREKKVLDAMCGSGQVAEFLRGRGCHIEALDISRAQVEIFQNKFPDIPVKEGSILCTGYPDHYFDIVVVVGGLHHIHPHIKSAVEEVHRILKPHGHFLFGDPHSHSIFEWIRKIWYRVDSLFVDNEASVNIEKLKDDFKDKFDQISLFYGGNVAYFFVYNSLILRMPMKIKKYISPPLIFMEKLILPFQTKFTSFYTIAQWKKR